MTPMSHSPYSPGLALSDFFVCFPELKKKKVLKGKCFAHVAEVKQKTAEAVKHIKINESKTVLNHGKNLSRCIASNGEYFEGD